MINTRQAVQAGKTPEKISISMITQDLKDGVNRTEMSIKYGIKPWEVDEMFKHPLLKGKRPARKRTLSFSFVDDVTEDTSEPQFAKREESTQFPSSIDNVTDEVDPNQVTLEQAIDETIEKVAEVQEQIQKIQEDVIDDLETPSFNDTMSVVEEQEWEKSGEEVEVEVEVEEDEFDSFQL